MELMKLDEAKEIIRKELQKDIVWLRNNEKNNDYFADKYRKEANAYHTVLAELDRLHKENDLAKKALIANSYEADERNNLLVKIQELQKENEELISEKTKLLLTDLAEANRLYDEENKRCMMFAIENNDLKEKLNNSISKDKISQKIDNRISTVEKILDEMIDKSIGCINVSLLNKKEKEEVINKRNCLTVQKATLEDIKKYLLKEE